MLDRIQLLFFFFLSLLFTSGLAFPTSDNSGVAPYEKVTAKINELFDSLLPTVRNLMVDNGLDPLLMDDLIMPVEGLIIHNGVLKMTKGDTQGMSNVIRAGDVTLSYGNKILTVDMNLGFDTLGVNYEYFFKYGLIKRTGDFHGIFSRVKLRVIVTMDMTTKIISLDSFKIVEMGKLDIRLEGHVFDPLLNAAIKGITTVFRKCVMEIIEKRVAEIFEHLLHEPNEKIQMPDQLRNSDSPTLDDAPVEFKFYLV